MCLRLSLLNSFHHLYSTCINHFLSLVVQIDFILNSYLWVCSSPIPELQNTLLPSKCYELWIMLWFFFFFHYFILWPTLGFSMKLGMHHFLHVKIKQPHNMKMQYVMHFFLKMSFCNYLLRKLNGFKNFSIKLCLKIIYDF